MKNKLICFVMLFIAGQVTAQGWQSSLVKVNNDGSLYYIPDSLGNVIPDFSKVGYFESNKKIPIVAVAKTIMPSGNNDATIIQAAIDELSKLAADKDGFRGAILLKKGTYTINGTIKINTSGIVLRGEGEETKLIAAGNVQHTLIAVSGTGKVKELPNTRKDIVDKYIPLGSTMLTLRSTEGLNVGDNIIVLRPGTDKWISDLKMDQIVPKEDTKQWTAADYDLTYERIITKISGNNIYIDNPIVMAMETQYGGGKIYKYNFDGRISHCAVKDLYMESEYESDTAENHGWDAISFNRIENGWIKNVTSKYFGYSCVNLGNQSKWITVDGCKCLDAKSQIIGGRRYSFNNDGQMNLFMNCRATEGRHDYVTGAKVAGPNVFYNCTAPPQTNMRILVRTTAGQQVLCMIILPPTEK